MSDDGRRRFGALRSEDIVALDERAVESGVAVEQLMEVAGFQVARCAWRVLGERPGRVTAVAGRGNNGGDALVGARFLATWGCDVRAWIISTNEHLAGHALLARHAGAASNSGVQTVVSVDRSEGRATIDRADLILDGILGTGLQSAPREPQASAIRALNDSVARVLSIDVPSGLGASSGEVFDPCVRAATTCTLVGMKAGLWAGEARAAAGELWVADIGMPLAAWQAAGLSQPADVRAGALLSVPSGTLS
ncbi:MAG: NAD(P)H-hydrate epimerase [Candidatus Dormibacteria bacterium]